MSLDVSKLERVRCCDRKTIARCPACAEAGDDRKGEHLAINANGSFGCIIYPGDSPDAKAHRKRIFALCGNREIQPLIVHNSQLVVRETRPRRPLGRQGRVLPHIVPTVKTNIFNLLEHQYPIPNIDASRPKSVPGVAISPAAAPDRPLSEHERALLVRRCGRDSDPLILEAIRLFNATIVGIKAASVTRCKPCEAEFYGRPESKFCSPQCWQKSLLEPLDEKVRLKSCLKYLSDFETRLERMGEEREPRNAEL